MDIEKQILENLHKLRGLYYGYGDPDYPNALPDKEPTWIPEAQDYLRRITQITSENDYLRNELDKLMKALNLYKKKYECDCTTEIVKDTQSITDALNIFDNIEERIEKGEELHEMEVAFTQSIELALSNTLDREVTCYHKL